METIYDVVVIGAGAAGLACARAFKEKNLKFLVLEARARVGGRMLTLDEPNGPVELGAEFMHTADNDFMEEFSKAHINFFDAIENRFMFRNKKLSLMKDFIVDIGKISGKMSVKKDRSIKEFLESNGRHMRAEIKPFFISYVEGFHAAQLELMGEKAFVANENDSSKELNGAGAFRPEGGYGRILHHWMRELGDASSWLRLESTVHRIDWQKNQVVVAGRSFRAIKCKKIVITIPISLLKSENPAAAIKINPAPIDFHKNLEGVHMGYVERITFDFKTRFWENLTEKPLGFMHSGPHDYFPTWWTQWPLRTPKLIAWQGGPKAFELASWSTEKQVDEALKTLSKMTRKTKIFLKSQMNGFYLHNWTTDPYSLGAYTYLGVDGARKLKKVSQGYEDTLFFAGEAFAEKSAQATVHGAIRSGLSTAEWVIKSLK